MEAIKENGAVEDDMGDGMQCSDHPFRNNLSGICSFCLQEKLGKLVSSSFPLPIRGSTSSSSSPPFRSEKVGTSGTTINGVPTSSSLSLAVRATCARTREEEFYYIKKTRIPFLLAKKKKIMASSQSDRDIVFKRSKSTTNPRRGSNFMDSDNDNYFTPRKNGRFWSFLYKQHGNGKKAEKIESITAGGSTVKASQRGFGGSSNIVVVEEDEEFSPSNSQATASASSFDRKVSRSRSVGCGSRSFSGDFFERISTGFGDCTLRRVESQREGKARNQQGGVMKERVKCGGIFRGFIMTSSSSSSSSSSHWVSSSSSTVTTADSHLHNGKNNWSWSWAFASPLRAFSSKQLYSSKDGNKRDHHHQATNKNSKPDLNAIPSLLAVRV